jgi:hypothetical protein
MSRIVLIFVVLATALAGCNSSHQSGGRHLVVSEKDNGHTLSVQPGDTVVLRLHSTYWHVDTPASDAVLKLVGHAVHAALHSCPPGVGCGTVTATFRVLHAGDGEVLAGRTTCGEALRCAGGDGHFRLTLDVT